MGKAFLQEGQQCDTRTQKDMVSGKCTELEGAEGQRAWGIGPNMQTLGPSSLD